MNVIKALIGMMRWKSRMKKLADKPAYTDAWWAEVIDSCEFLPEEARRDFVNKFVSSMIIF